VAANRLAAVVVEAILDVADRGDVRRGDDKDGEALRRVVVRLALVVRFLVRARRCIIDEYYLASLLSANHGK
jgi:hypothetical protein